MKWILRAFGLILFAALTVYLVADLRLKPMNEEARQNASGEFVSLTDGIIHYQWDGPEDGPVIVLAHGFTTPFFIYEQNVEALNAAGFRTLRFDHFGRGWSDRPGGKYDIDFYDRALLELVDSQGLDQPFGLGGLSMGGPIVAEFAARHPERVSRVLLLVPAGLDLAATDSGGAALMRTPVLGDWVWRLFGRDISLGDGQYEETTLAPENRLQGDVSVQFDYRGALQAMLSSFRHLPMTGREDTFTRLAATGLPVLAIYGEADETVLVSSAEKLRTLMPEADIRVLAEGGHGLNYQNHQTVNPWLTEWFAETLIAN